MKLHEIQAPATSAASNLQPAKTDSQQQAKLVAGAHEFEAMLLNEMLKPLKFGQAEATEDGADETGGSQSDTIRGFATEAMSKAIANNGGFGLSKQIIQQVTSEHEQKAGEHDQRAGKKVGTKVW